ncbi:MAG: hypothetical protein IJ740_14370 [Ruminococcus sp.]|nr:hypothetical protein [Ruminococcus sp.]
MTCTDCGYTYSETTEKLSHTFKPDTKEPTCTEDGYTRQKCIVCEMIRNEFTIPANGHSYTERVIKPTYTTQGYTLHTCSVCGDSYKVN